MDTNLEPDTAYEYRVSVVNTSGFEVASLHQRIDGYMTRAVSLLPLEFDPAAGTVHLAWTRYRDPGFEQYQVYRRKVGTDTDSLLEVRTDLDDTTFVDGNARHQIDYAYWLIVTAAGQELSSNSVEGQLVLPAVQDLRVDFDSRSATATLEWTPYQGPRFTAYRVESRTAGLVPQKVARIATLGVASLVDIGLEGNTRYFYRVVVETEAGKEVASEEARGIFHPWVDSWPLAVEEQGYVRLYAEPDGRIVALAAGPDGVRLLFFDSEGNLLDEWLLLESNHGFEPPSAGMAKLSDGRRVLSLATGQTIGLLLLGSEGRLIQVEQSLFAEAVEQPLFAEALESLSGPETLVYGLITLRGGEGEGRIGFDNLRISSDDSTLFVENFTSNSTSGEGAWKGFFFGLKFENGWGWISGGEPFITAASVRDNLFGQSAWQDLRLEADVVLQGGRAGFQMGRKGYPILALELDSSAQRMALDWTFNPPVELGLDNRVERFEEPIVVVNNRVYRLGLEVAGGQVRAWVQSPVVWSGAKDGNSPWADLIVDPSVGRMVLVAGSQRHIINREWNELSFIPPPIDMPVSQVRLWKLGGESQSLLGICLPEMNRVVVRHIVSPVLIGLQDWPKIGDEETLVLGTGGGYEAGSLFFPLSVDWGPDGRFFVLDAGNARVQVFDAAGNHLTEWGRKGSSEGMFNFGSGWVAEDFAGNLCVDDDGYIYVADVGNRRIQKFAP